MKGSKIKPTNKSNREKNAKLPSHVPKSSKKQDDRITVDSTSNFINQPTTEWPQWSIDIVEPQAKEKKTKIEPLKGKSVQKRKGGEKIEIQIVPMSKKRWFNRGRIDIDRDMLQNNVISLQNKNTNRL